MFLFVCLSVFVSACLCLFMCFYFFVSFSASPDLNLSVDVLIVKDHYDVTLYSPVNINPVEAIVIEMPLTGCTITATASGANASTSATYIVVCSVHRHCRHTVIKQISDHQSCCLSMPWLLQLDNDDKQCKHHQQQKLQFHAFVHEVYCIYCCAPIRTVWHAENRYIHVCLYPHIILCILYNLL